MSYEVFKAKVVWADTAERFRIVQTCEDRGESAASKSEALSSVIYVAEETTERDALGVPIWVRYSAGDRAFVYAFARDWKRLSKALEKIAGETTRPQWACPRSPDEGAT